MSTANAAATLERADDFAADYGAASLIIRDGTTVLATHTLAGFTTSNNGADGRVTASAIPNATIVADGTADNVILQGLSGNEYSLTVGASGADVNISNLTFVTGQDSIINSFVVDFPA